MGQLREMKREKVAHSLSPSLANLKEAYDFGYAEGKADGYNSGAAEQRKLDIESVMKLLDGLESMHGIGIVTANKIRYLVSNKFEQRSDLDE